MNSDIGINVTHIPEVVRFLSVYPMSNSIISYPFRYSDIGSSIALLEAKWLNFKANSTVFHFPTIEKDSVTYRDCCRSRLFVSEEKLCLELIVYDGDLLNGFPVEKRCMFTLALVTDTIPPGIQDIVRTHYHNVVERCKRDIKAEITARRENRILRVAVAKVMSKV